jgi:hypothetical protein
MAKSAFDTPLRRLRRETEWLRYEFAKASAAPDSRQSQLICEMSVIRIYDSWARFCRETVITSAYGKTVTLSGIRLTASSLPAITSKSQVIPALLSTYKNRIYEPDWERADQCIDAGSRLAVQNLSTIAAAFGASNSPADEIRHIRNFYAHRRRGSCANALATNYFPTLRRPVVFRLNDFSVGGGTVLESWIQRLLAIADASVQ